jgi:hypothetical protein
MTVVNTPANQLVNNTLELNDAKKLELKDNVSK